MNLRKSKMNITKIVFILFIIMGTATYSATRFVSKTGGNTPPYTTWATASSTITTCINYSQSGDTILVGNGTYDELIRFKKGITLIGINRDNCILTNISNYTSLDNSTVMLQDSCTLQSFTVLYKTFFDYPIWPTNVAIYANNLDTAKITCRVVNNIISIFCDYGEPTWTIFSIEFDNTGGEICNNWINPIERNTNIPLQTAIKFTKGSNPLLSNNHFYKFNKGLYVIKSNPIVVNNFFGKCSFVFEVDTSKLKIMYNSFFNNNQISHYLTLDSTNLTVDPMFVDSLTDFHLRKYSPLINAGDPSILNKDGSRSDIGLYGGPYGETYAYPNFAPNVPLGFTGSIDQNNKIKFKWQKNIEPDLAGYKLYFDSLYNYPITPNRLIATIQKSDTSFLLNQPLVAKAYYKITAFDTEGKESIGSNEIAIITTDIDDTKQDLPLEFNLGQNYPNPFNPETMISYNLKNDGIAKVVIINSIGEEIMTLLNEYKPAGKYSIPFSAKNLSSGIYFYKLTSGSFTSVRKMILIK